VDSVQEDDVDQVGLCTSGKRSPWSRNGSTGFLIATGVNDPASKLGCGGVICGSETTRTLGVLTRTIIFLQPGFVELQRHA
jgi:hypothetical protein